MRRRIAAAAGTLVLAALGAGCFPVTAAPPDPWAGERAECEAGVADARAALGAARMAAPVGCNFTELPAGGVFLGGVATVFYGPHAAATTRAEYRSVAAHELGHAWDFGRLHDGHRARFAAIMGYPWATERYADVFMLVTLNLAGPGWYGTPAPTPPQRAALCGEAIVPC